MRRSLNLPTFAEKPDLWDDPYFEDMVQEAEFANMSFDEQEAYIQAMKHRWDYQNTIDYARKEGKIDVAKEMLADHVPVETIMKYTGLTEEQVRALWRLGTVSTHKERQHSGNPCLLPFLYSGGLGMWCTAPFPGRKGAIVNNSVDNFLIIIFLL